MNGEIANDLLPVDALLRRAARDFAYPVTPRIAEAVSARLREQARPASASHLWDMRLVRAAAGVTAALLLVVAGSLVVPQSRDALADFFGLSQVRVDRTPYVGPTPPVLSPESHAEPATIEQARAAVDFPLRFHERDGVRFYPREVYTQFADTDSAVAIFVYLDFDLYQTRLGLFGKGGPDPSLIHEIEFDGHGAYWVDEGGHIAESYDPQGRLVVDFVRTVNRATLLWEEEGVTYRLETSLSQEEAIEVARSLR